MIRKLFWFIVGFCIVFACFLVNAEAQTWHNVNQFTCAWDAVTTDADGDPLPLDGSLRYRLYIANADTDPNKTNPVQVADVTVLEEVVTLNTKGRYFVGIQAVWIYTDNSELTSEINWADEIEGQESVDLWAIRYHASPKLPKNLTR